MDHITFQIHNDMKNYKTESLVNGLGVEFVLPNLSTFTQRGSIVDRSKISEAITREHNSMQFQMIEIPGDFVKNKTETEKTGLSLGSILTNDSVLKIYSKEDGISKPYCLHTEPGIPRRIGRISKTCKLRWFDDSWLNLFFRHVMTIINFLGKSPAVIEVHPGTQQRKNNNMKSLAFGLETLMIRLEEKLGFIPNIFIENRTPHIISSGSDIGEFRDALSSLDFYDRYPIGIILDIQQLYSKTRGRFVEELWKIPHDIIRGFHIHELHRTPTLKGKIDWYAVREYIESENFKTDLHILPEVHHMNQLII